jgi:hypothetical protein
MNHLVFGSNSSNVSDLGELLYSGQDGDEAEKVIADNRDKFAVIRRTLSGFEHMLRSVQQFDPNHPAVVAAATDAEKSSSPEPETGEAAEAPAEAEPEVTPEPKQKRSTKK